MTAKKKAADDKAAREKVQAEQRAARYRQADADAGRARRGEFRRDARPSTRPTARRSRAKSPTKTSKRTSPPAATTPARCSRNRRTPTPRRQRRLKQMPNVLSRVLSAFGLRAAEGAVRPGPYFLPITGGLLPADVGDSMNWWQLGFNPLPAAGRSAIVEACVSAYAQTVAMCPGDHWRLNNKGGRERVKNSAASRVLRRPNDYQIMSDFMLGATRSLYLDGNTYALGLRNDRFEIDELHLMKPELSFPVLAETGEVFYQLYGNDVINKRDQQRAAHGAAARRAARPAQYPRALSATADRRVAAARRARRHRRRLGHRLAANEFLSQRGATVGRFVDRPGARQRSDAGAARPLERSSKRSASGRHADPDRRSESPAMVDGRQRCRRPPSS